MQRPNWIFNALIITFKCQLCWITSAQSPRRRSTSSFWLTLDCTSLWVILTIHLFLANLLKNMRWSFATMHPSNSISVCSGDDGNPNIKSSSLHSYDVILKMLMHFYNLLCNSFHAQQMDMATTEFLSTTKGINRTSTSERISYPK